MNNRETIAKLVGYGFIGVMLDEASDVALDLSNRELAVRIKSVADEVATLFEEIEAGVEEVLNGL